MADGITNERQSIRDSARSLKKYGSTCNHFKRQDHIKHIIVEGETLQGIALKYGVTMEEVRRANLLWASDSLYLRESLLIPVARDSTFSSTSSSLNSTSNSQLQSPVTPSDYTSDMSEESVSDFLVKIDTSIANTKNQVKKTQHFSEFCGDEEDGLFTRRKPATSRLRQHQQQQSTRLSSGEFDDILTTPQPVVMTQGRHVRSSLQRLQKEQDEMFEL